MSSVPQVRDSSRFVSTTPAETPAPILFRDVANPLTTPNAGPRGVMLRPVHGGSVLDDCSAFNLRIGRLLGNTIGVIKPIEGLRLGSLEFEALLDAETQSVARAGNRVKLLPDGKSAFEARDRLFASAKEGETIHQQTFASGDDHVGWRNARQMRAHAGKGPARHLYDAVGSAAAVLNSRRIFTFMKLGGVEVEELGTRLTEMLGRPNRLRHQKLLLLGNRLAIVGGMNIGNMYAYNGRAGSGVEGPTGALKIVGWEKPYRLVDMRSVFGFRKLPVYRQPWHDIDFQIEGPAVADMQRAFIQSWTERGHTIDASTIAELTNPAAAPFFDDGCRVRFVNHRPHDDGDDHITAAMVRHIDAAVSSIVIETPYFSPPPAIRAALIRARVRHVPVTIVTNSRQGTNSKIAYDAGHGYYPELLKHGVAIYERKRMLHGKVMVLDDAVTLGGSANLNGRTRHCDAETLVIVNDPEVALQTRATVEGNVADATRITMDMLGGFVTATRDLLAAFLRPSA